MRINNKILYLAVFIFILLIFLPFSNAITVEQDSINDLYLNDYDEIRILREIQQAIKEKNAEWTANTTSVSAYSQDELKILLNAVPDKSDEANKKENPPVNINIPDKFDWRNVNGTDWTTPIKNQGDCGACVAFAFIGALETVVQINANNTFNCDLSEAHLLFCTGGSCDFGILPWDALEYLQDYGVTDESCFPYNDIDMNCQSKCPDWESRTVKVNTSGFASYGEIKDALINYGPLFTSFTPHVDFYSYKEGIYEPVWGAPLSPHCVSIIGYNDIEEYWICKNSWGPNWGENGYFRIKYRKCGIDVDARYMTVFESNPPTTPIIPEGPKTGQAGTPYYFKTISEDPDNNGIYYLFDWGDRPDYELIPPQASGEIINVSHVWSVKNQDVFTIRVKAMDVYGYESNWSANTTIYIHNNPPDTPTKPDGPSRMRPREETTYITFLNDSNGDQIYYLWDWGDDSDQEWIGPVNSGENISSGHVWNSRSKFVIKVKARDEHGAESDWSEPLTIWGSKVKSNTFNNFLSIIERLLQLLNFQK